MTLRSGAKIGSTNPTVLGVVPRDPSDHATLRTRPAASATDTVVSSTQAHSHDHATVALKGSSGKHYHGKLVLDPNAPASFFERPDEGTHFTCPVSGGVFEMESHTRGSLYEGRYYAFCCGGCAQDFDADPAFFVNRLKEAISEQ